MSITPSIIYSCNLSTISCPDFFDYNNVEDTFFTDYKLCLDVLKYAFANQIFVICEVNLWKEKEEVFSKFDTLFEDKNENVEIFFNLKSFTFENQDEYYVNVENHLENHSDECKGEDDDETEYKYICLQILKAQVDDPVWYVRNLKECYFDK